MTAKRERTRRAIFAGGEVREVADMNCVDIIGGDFSVAAFRETRKLGRIEDPCGLVFAHAPRRSPDVGIDGGFCRLMRVDQNERKREKTWNIHQHGSIQAAHLLV